MNQQNGQHGQIEINPFAILAAVLFHVGKSEIEMVAADDSGEGVQVLKPSVVIEQKGEALVCALSGDKILSYQSDPYAFRIAFNEGTAYLCFEKIPKSPLLISTNGQPIQSKDSVIPELIKKVSNG